MEVLAAGLRGQALLAQRVKELLFDDSVTMRVEVDSSFETGSLIVPVHIVVDGLRTAEQLFAGQASTAIANLLSMLGFLGVSATSLYALFKRRKGRKIESPNDLPADLRIDLAVETLIRIYNDNEVQTQLRKTLEPLRHAGIEEFQTRRAGIVVQVVRKADLQAADEAEIDNLTQDEEVVLDIEKVAWRKNLAWHFNDGRTSFDAKIEDDGFWRSIAHEAFSDGDRMRVHLRTTARRTRFGTLKVQRVIPKVISVDHARRRQGNLFEPNA